MRKKVSHRTKAKEKQVQRCGTYKYELIKEKQG